MVGETERREIRKKTIKTLKGKQAFKNEIDRRFSSSESDRIWRNAHKRLFKMYARHRDLPKGVGAHTDSFIFPAAAIYLAMKEVDPGMAYEIMKKIMAERSGKMGRMLSVCCRIPGFKSFFLGMWDAVSRKMFGSASGFKNVFYPKEKGCFRMDITKCPYNKYLTELGCPELNILFCENDVHSYGNLPGL